MAIHETHHALARPRFDRPTRLLLAVAPFYRDIADALIAGARAAVETAGATHETIELPGALELPPAIRIASRSGHYDGFVALGCVIRGETTHYETVYNDSSRGLMQLGLDGLCIGNGSLTVARHEQAVVRADPAGQDKGGGAADAAMHLIALARRFAPRGRPLPKGSFRLAGAGRGSRLR
jgi:6,7-dimethyl-8-ribityllumazine synthase